ncbi:hypothetical protein DFQ27_004011, partial [Actinomortierella ambigua]
MANLFGGSATHRASRPRASSFHNGVGMTFGRTSPITPAVPSSTFNTSQSLLSSAAVIAAQPESGAHAWKQDHQQQQQQQQQQQSQGQGVLHGKQAKTRPQFCSEFFRKYELMIEFSNLRNPQHCPRGLYVMPAADNMNLWFGTIFIHKGYYRDAVFKFKMTIPPEYPEKRPTVHFLSEIFHPLIDQKDNNRELMLQYQFPTWTPHQDYLFHVLHFIKACFKKCILDRTTEKQAINKEAQRMYRHEPTIFAKLAQQSAQLSIAEPSLYEHHFPNNSIKFSPMSDPEFDDLKQQMMNSAPSPVVHALAFNASTVDRMTDNVKRTATGIPIPGPDMMGRPDWALDPENLDRDMSQVPLFMQNLTAEALDNPLIQALQELAYDGTPEEVAENFKNQGNECFKQGKKFYKDAIDYYTKALDVQCSDDKLNETLYVNRAACNLHF